MPRRHAPPPFFLITIRYKQKKVSSPKLATYWLMVPKFNLFAGLSIWDSCSQLTVLAVWSSLALWFVYGGGHTKNFAVINNCYTCCTCVIHFSTDLCYYHIFGLNVHILIFIYISWSCSRRNNVKSCFFSKGICSFGFQLPNLS